MANFEEIDEVAPSRTFHQLGILCLDGSGSMQNIGDGGISLAENVNRAVREFLGYFKTSSIVNNFSIAVITFDHEAKVHTPVTELVNIDDFADFNPLNGHGGGTYIGGALELSEQMATKFMNSPESSIVPHSVSVVVLSDGLCLREEETKMIADRIKQKQSITLCSSLFAEKSNIGSSDTQHAKTVLQDIASGVQFYKTVYTESDLRKFFISSMSSNKSINNG